jgi:WD40 repeat protein
VQFSPDGKQLLIGGFDGTVKVWDLATMKQAAHFDHATAGEYAAPARPVVWIPGRSEILAGGVTRDGVVIWDGATGEESALIEAQESSFTTSAAATTDGRLIAIGGSNLPRISLYDAATRTVVRSLAIPAQNAKTSARREAASSSGALVLAFSHDDKRLVSGHEDGRVIVWNVESGKRLQTFTAGVVGRVLA